MVESSRLVPGDRVQVRTPQEILATLDPEGCLQGMPFMPEMLAHAGKEFRVFKRADKTCDSIAWTGLRQLENTVHLAGLRCDGSAHDGCQAGCLFYWNEAWLQRVTPAASPPSSHAAAQGPNDSAADEAVRTALQRHTTRGTTAEGEPIYRCQTTEVLRASKPLPWYRPGQYWRDMRDNGVPLRQVIFGIGLSVVNTLLRKLGRPIIPRVAGNLKKTPTVDLGLKPGDMVRVKSHAEILQTLDRTGRNRGLTFDPEMTVYCGQTLPVLRIVDKIIEEASGKMVHLPGKCIILANGVCTAVYHRFCPRSTYAYWREIWLERVD